MEIGLNQCSDLQGALMVGTGYRRPALLLESKNLAETRNDLLEKIYGVVEKLNRHNFVDHRILRSHIVIVTGEQRMVRSIKGAIQRSATLAMFQEDLKNLYESTDDA